MIRFGRFIKLSALSIQILIVASLLFSSFAVAADITPRMKLKARRAAKIDALRNLSETVYGVRLDGSSTVGNFVLASDVIRTRLSVAIRGAKEIDYQELSDGTAQVTVEITVGEVESILGEQLQYDQEVIEGVGYGAPSGSHQAQPVVPSGNMIQATGYGLAPNEPGLSVVEADLLGFRAARNDALRNLAEQINRVLVSSRSTVREFSLHSDDVRTKVNGAINGAKVVSEKKLKDSRYEVVVETNIGPLLN